MVAALRNSHPPTSIDVTEPMERGLAKLQQLGGVFRVDFNYGLRPNTLDALVRRGLAVRVERLHRRLGFTMPFWLVSPAGEAYLKAMAER